MTHSENKKPTSISLIQQESIEVLQSAIDEALRLGFNSYMVTPHEQLINGYWIKLYYKKTPEELRQEKISELKKQLKELESETN